MNKYNMKKFELEAIADACVNLEERAESAERDADTYETRAKEQDEENPKDTWEYRAALENRERANGYRNAAERIYGLLSTK